MRRVTALICLGVILTAGTASAAFLTATFTETPGLNIPDSPGGAGTPVSATMDIALDHYISEIRVYIDVTTDWSSDLRIWVVSAWDTQVELLFIGEGGEPGVNPAGWYPTDFTPREDMTQWYDEGAGGTWTIICQDWSQGGGDSTLNEWRVEIGYDDTVATDARTLSDVKALFE